MKTGKKIIDRLTFFIVLAFLLLMVINIKSTSVSVKNALVVWSNTFLLSAFPFIFFSGVLIYTNAFDFIVEILGNIFYKLFKAPLLSGYIFFMSILCGYPMGITLVSSFIKKGYISIEEGNKILSFCSHSGVLYVIGVIGIVRLDSLRDGLLIFAVHIISSLIVGLIFRKAYKTQNNNRITIINQTKDIVGDTMSATINTILMVGGFTIISSLIIDLVINMEITQGVIGTLSGIFGCEQEVIRATICGIMELTYGINELTLLNVNKKLIKIISCGLLSFGGLSLIIENYYVTDTNKKFYLLTKFVHTVISVIIGIIIFGIL